MGIPIEESFLKLADRQLDEASLTKLIETFRNTYKTIEKTISMNLPELQRLLQVYITKGKSFSWYLVKKVMY